MFIKGKDKFDIFIEVCIVLLAMYASFAVHSADNVPGVFY